MSGKWFYYLSATSRLLRLVQLEIVILFCIYVCWAVAYSFEPWNEVLNSEISY